MKSIIKSALLALCLALSSGVVLADPPSSNPVVGDGYVSTNFECFANLCEVQTFYYEYVIVNGVGMWLIVRTEVRVLPRRPLLQ